MRKYVFAHESFYLQGILNDINEQDTSFLDCKHKHMIKSGAPPDKVRVHGFTSRINSKGYHSLVTGLISIFLEMVWARPFKACKPCTQRVPHLKCVSNIRYLMVFCYSSIPQGGNIFKKSNF